jgi:electron transfer flavoprotein beta subunit
MKILVPIKSVPDPGLNIRIDPLSGDVDLAGMKMVINPFDEVALEEALRLKASIVGTTVHAVSVGSDAVQEVLRHALALGADTALQVVVATRVEPLGVAKLLHALSLRDSPDLIILGKQAVDDDLGQTGQMLSYLAQWPQATSASKLEISGGIARVHREVEGGVDITSVSMPAVVTVDLNLNTPRFPSLANVMRARKLPIERVTAEEFAVDVAPRLSVLGFSLPAGRPKVTMCNTVDQLLAELRSFPVLERVLERSGG